VEVGSVVCGDVDVVDEVDVRQVQATCVKVCRNEHANTERARLRDSTSAHPTPCCADARDAPRPSRPCVAAGAASLAKTQTDIERG
jgi:hypothetical protein